jgi:hypothetical protein
VRNKDLPDDPSIEVLEGDDFARLMNDYKYTESRVANTGIPIADRQVSGHRKTNLDGFFQECKPSKNPAKNSGSRVKTTLTTRVSIPVVKKKPIPKPPKPVEEPPTSFFTTWAAAQAPSTRPATTSKSSKPRRKATKKKDVEVILLSPRTGQRTIRTESATVERGMLGEKSCGGMWDACKRGLDGELYDCEGVIVFSQELRRKSSADIPLQEVEIVSLDESEATPKRADRREVDHDVLDDIIVENVETITPGKPVKRKAKATETCENGMPNYSRFTIPQLQVSHAQTL